MTTRLDSALRRELIVEGQPYTLTLDTQGLKLVPKGKRKGYELEWDAFINGEAALATALNASIAAAPEPLAPKGQKPSSAPKKSPTLAKSPAEKSLKLVKPASAREKSLKLVKPGSAHEKPHPAKRRKT